MLPLIGRLVATLKPLTMAGEAPTGSQTVAARLVAYSRTKPAAFVGQDIARLPAEAEAPNAGAVVAKAVAAE